MNLTRIPVHDAKPGDRVPLKGGVAVVTKVHRPRMADYLRITMVDDSGGVHSTRYLDGPFDSPTNWTLDVLT